MTQPPPDTKDWTWVLERPCAECGLTSAQISGDELPAVIRDAALRWTQVLAGTDVRRRPEPLVWSPLEYACHVRDVLGIFEGRLATILTDDDATFPNWDQDQAAVDGRYAEQDPAVVAEDLVAAGERCAARFATVTGDQWARGGMRSNGSWLTALTLGQYMAHDVLHHLVDVGRELGHPLARNGQETTNS